MQKVFILLTILLFSCKANCTDYSEFMATHYGNKYKTTRRTASGKIFNVNAMTCAAPKKYKFGTKLKVTNPKNKKSIIVEVTDRGAFGNGIIDLTYGAFKKIAHPKAGKIKVHIKIVND